jgi:V8-like Glu-specific endopeptidase
VALVTVAACGTTATASGRAAPTSHPFSGTPTVGALFMSGLYPTLHTCSASVVESTSGDVIMTAAHCVQGTAKRYVFVPGYRRGKAPYGVWKVVAAYGSAGWIKHQNTQRDWAFLVVATHVMKGHRRHLQQVTGANPLGSGARRGEQIQVPAYPLGSVDLPITCAAKVYLHAGFPAFNCGGYVGGTSGAPWLSGGAGHHTVVGVIGGLHQGGCEPSTSYAARLGHPARAALSRAEHRGRADAFPSRPSDGC